MKFGEYIKSLRDRSGLMQRELADRVGISASMLSRLEAGERDPTVRILGLLGRALDVPTSALLSVALADVEDARLDAKQLQIAERLARATQHAVSVARIRRLREE